MAAVDTEMNLNVSFKALLAGFAAAALAAILVLGIPAYHLAKAPVEATGGLLVVFPPGLDHDAMFQAIHKAGGLPVRQASFGASWVAQSEKAGFVEAVTEQGAFAVFRDVPGGFVLAGCTGVIAMLQD